MIGADGGIPWRLPADQQFFKSITMGHTLLMGRATWDSIGRPLPGRETIVISRNRDLTLAGAHVVHGLEEAIELASGLGAEECFVVGGAAIYEAALPLADRLWLTRVELVVDGDVRFPDFESGAFGRWKLIEEDPHSADARNAHAFSIQHWEREDGPG